MFTLHWFIKENAAFSRMNQKSHIYLKDKNSSEVFITFDDPSDHFNVSARWQSSFPDGMFFRIYWEHAILHSAKAISKLLWLNCTLFIRCLLCNNTTMSEFGLNYPKIKLKYWCLSISFFCIALCYSFPRTVYIVFFFNRQLLYQ